MLDDVALIVFIAVCLAALVGLAIVWIVWLSGELRRMHAQHERLRNEVAALESERKEKVKQLRALAAGCQEWEIRVREQRQQTDNLQAHLRLMHAEARQREETLADLHRQAESREEESRQQQARLAELEAARATAQADHDGLASVLEALRHEIDQRNTSLTDLNEAVSASQAEHATLTNKLGALRHQTTAEEQRLGDLYPQREQMESRIAERKKLASDLQAQLEPLERKVRDQQETLTEFQSERAKLADGIRQHEEQLTKLNTAIEEREAYIVSKLKEFSVSPHRPLPVIILADVSGSMSSNGKIDVLNSAVAQMIAAFAEEDAPIDIQVAIVTFGQDARLYQPLESVSQMTWQNTEAKGKTPMGAAFELARQILEDRTQIPSRAYAPTLVLVSDGQPTDEWERPLEQLLSSDRASKAARFAMAVGDDADRDMLRKFLGDLDTKIFEGHEAREISKFFRWVTMSVTSRSRSMNPNQIEYTESDDLELDY